LIVLILTDLFCCCCNGGVAVFCRLPPTTVNGCSCSCCCFGIGCVGFLVVVVVDKLVVNVCLFDVCDNGTGTFVCCLVDSSSSLGVDFGWVADGARVVIGFLVLLSVWIDSGGVVVRVLFLLRLRAFDDVSTVCTGAVNNSWYYKRKKRNDLIRDKSLVIY